MDRNFAAVTIFTLLFAVSTARISLDPTPADSHANVDVDMQEPPLDCIEDSNLPLLPKKPSSGSDRVSESSDKDRIRSEFARFHAINRHFFDEPRVPLRSTVNTRPDLNPSVKQVGDEIALKKRLKFEHDYRRERYQHQHHLHHRIMDKYNDDEDVSMPMKRQFVGEKVKTRARPEAGFMRSIRKFLKHNLE